MVSSISIRLLAINLYSIKWSYHCCLRYARMASSSSSSDELPTTPEAAIMSNYHRNVFKIRCKGYSGSITGTGCLINKQYGLLVTNIHICKDIRQVELEYHNMITSDTCADSVLKFKGRVVYVEPQYDLALVRVQFDNSSDNNDNQLTDQFELIDKLPDFGDCLVCLGHPLPGNYSMTAGIVGCGHRKFEAISQLYFADNPFVGHTCGTANGYSGGPLIDEMGRLAGIHHSSYDPTGSRCATHATKVNEFYETAKWFHQKKSRYQNDRKWLIEKQSDLTDRLKLGLEIYWFRKSLVEKFWYQKMATIEGRVFNVKCQFDGHILVWNILKPIDNNVLEKERLLQFDIIITINGNLVKSVDDLYNTVESNPWKSIGLTVFRNKTIIDITLNPQQLPLESLGFA